MLKLVLIRHAKSDWGNAAMADFDRPLAARGLRAAAWLGEALQQRGIAPALVLCSPALRTRQTLEMSGLGGEVRFEPLIYGERDADYLEVIRSVGGAASPLIVVGHNSATAVTAELLAGDTAGVDFPTAAFAIIEFAVSDWQDLASGQGTLVEYCVPPRG